MKTLQDHQAPLDLEIVGELIDILPEDWEAATLEIEYAPLPDDRESLKIGIRSPEGLRDLVEPSDALFDSARRLVKLMEQYGHHLSNAVYVAELTPEEQWDFKAKYKYRDAPGAAAN